ncbi:ankyrin repeat domain-containing protein 39-like isoform X3 [Hyposmocoma kahamanoa]|nr:ankyrin repeat domain-containing protein 39-like isoform X3 [Hyposmocoma kahamanoa]
MSKKYPISGVDVVNGVTIKTNVLNAINSLSQLGYKITSSTGETEITWTLQPMDDICDHTNCTHSANKSVCQTLSEMDWERGIWYAAYNGDNQKVQSIIDKARNAKEAVNALDNAGYTALHYAARTGNTDICKTLLYNGADINATTNGKATPLHKAAAAGKLATVKFLIQTGACVDAQDVDGQTALHKAVENKNHELTAILLELCPKLAQIKDTKGRLPTELVMQ